MAGTQIISGGPLQGVASDGSGFHSHRLGGELSWSPCSRNNGDPGQLTAQKGHSLVLNSGSGPRHWDSKFGSLT